MTLAELLKTRKPPFILKNLQHSSYTTHWSSDIAQVVRVSGEELAVLCNLREEDYPGPFGNHSSTARKSGFKLGWAVHLNNPPGNSNPRYISFDSWSLNP